MSSFARRDLLSLAPAAVEAQDELVALDLDGSRTHPKSPNIRAKENIYINLINHNDSSHRPAFSWKAKSLFGQRTTGLVAIRAVSCQPETSAP